MFKKKTIVKVSKSENEIINDIIIMFHNYDSHLSKKEAYEIMKIITKKTPIPFLKSPHIYG